ncbi:MAG: hypothetical protein PHF37_00880 [Phycisphaerae bacterium]|nr:hypothetical protein [Phycisphaerae bacterium]
MEDYYKIMDSLSCDRQASVETLEAIEILSERLERLKQISPCFAAVDFSPEVKALTDSKVPVY